ncbi:MAG: hypothetical protein KAS59_06365 [Alphaproteobacteria bacterium]|nr:hypothetical protein [Alphaproteobacteria bacterium]
MSEVTLTSAMRANLLSLQSTAILMGQTQFRLSTGNRVNSALDNPSSFFAAQSLNNRAADLSSLLDGMGQNIQVLTAASQGIDGLSALVNQAKAVAQTAQSQATGGAMYTGTISLTAAEQADITTVGGVGVLGVDADDTFTVQMGSGAVTTFTIGASQTLQSLLDQMNKISGMSATTVAGTNTGEVFVQIRSTNGESITIAEGTNTPATFLFGVDSIDTHAATTTAPTDQVSLEKQYNDLRTQIDEFITDTGYRGKNLLNGDVMSTQFNESNSSSLSVTGTTRDAAGLGLLAATFGTTGGIQDNLDQITASLDLLRSDGSNYGNALAIITTRQDFTTNLIATLKDGATFLTIADKNEEGANLLALQTSQQLGIQALALASQANQSVLRLFS